MTGWFTEDFTLAELKTLRAIERLPALRPANMAHDGLYQVPTLQEVIDLAKREGVGIYPETKHPTYHDSVGLSLEEPLVKALRANGLDRRDAAVFVQSFEVSNLQELNRELKVNIVQLTSASGRPYDFTVKSDPRTYADLTTPSGLRWVARYADGLGPDKNQIVPRDAQNRLLAPTSLVQDAHRAGLQVHPYTFRPENNFLPGGLPGGATRRPGIPALARQPAGRAQAVLQARCRRRVRRQPGHGGGRPAEGLWPLAVCKIDDGWPRTTHFAAAQATLPTSGG